MNRQHAPNVCENCRYRKKACDKSLPGCGYCTKKELVCDYSLDDTRPAAADGLHYDNRLVHKRSGSLARKAANGISYGLSNQNNSLQSRIRAALEATGHSTLRIRDDFLAGAYRWLPIVAPWRLTSNNINLGSPRTDIDSLMLLLVMSLFARSDTGQETAALRLYQRGNHTVVRGLFAEFQIQANTSAMVVQSAILLATFEFATRHLELAYATIRTADSIYRLLERKMGPERCRPNRHDAIRSLEIAELRQTYLGLIIVQRIIAAELNPQNSPGLLNFHPYDESSVPLDEERFDLDPMALTATTFEPRIHAAMDCYQGDGFRRLAQAVFWLEQVMKYVAQDAHEVLPKLEALQELDMHVHMFLEHAMAAFRIIGHHCGANSVSIRSLLVLHKGVLGWLSQDLSTDEICSYYEARSWVAFTSAARMMARVADDHKDKVDNPDMLPLTASYSMRLSVKHLQGLEPPRSQADEQDLRALRIMNEAFQRRWCFEDSDP